MGSQEVTVDQFMPLEASEIGAEATEEAGGGYEFEPNHLKYWGVFFLDTWKGALYAACRGLSLRTRSK